MNRSGVYKLILWKIVKVAFLFYFLSWPLRFRQSHGLCATPVTDSLTDVYLKRQEQTNLSTVKYIRTFSLLSKTFSGHSQDFLRTFLGLSQDILKTFSGPSQEFVIAFSRLSHNFLRTFSGLSPDFLRTFLGTLHM